MPPKKAQPQPKNHQIFDTWSSASTGHQRADGPTLSHTTTWRDSRTGKLSRQFAFGDCNADQKGRGELMLRDKGKEERDIRDFMGGVQKRKRDIEDGKVKCIQGDTSTSTSTKTTLMHMPTATSMQNTNRDTADTIASDTDTATDAATPAPALADADADANPPIQKPGKKILTGATIYINGSTMPLISDHKLKHLLVSHGAKLSLVLSRSVTHIIIGRPNSPHSVGASKGAGGGLAAGKLQKEIERCGRGVKVVGVEWAIESIKADRRLSETKFALKLGRQPSVLGMFK